MQLLFICCTCRFSAWSTRVGIAVGYRCPCSLPDPAPAGPQVNFPCYTGYDADTPRGDAPHRMVKIPHFWNYVKQNLCFFTICLQIMLTAQYFVFCLSSSRKILFSAFPIPCDYGIIPVICSSTCEESMKVFLKNPTVDPEIHCGTDTLSAETPVLADSLSRITLSTVRYGPEDL